MKIIAILLSLTLSVPADGQPAPAPSPENPSALPPIVITAPRLKPAQVRRLKQARAAGSAAAISGTGILIYSALALGAGPIGWAAALIFCGGMTAYLSHRRLQGQDDFGPTNASPNTAARAPSPPSP